MKRILVLLMCCVPFMAYATLGESESSIAKDNRTFASLSSLVVTKQVNLASTQSVPNGKYTVSLIQSTNNIMIKEFSANGKVFAVTWRGPRNPDLAQLFGTYFEDYKTIKPKFNSLTVRNVSANDLVVNTSGYVGDFHGVAYVPSLMPAGVTLNDLNK